MNFQAVPVPDRMKHLPLDPRGYPIPWIVYRDQNGRAHFQINNEHLRLRCLNEDLCSICGQKLFRGRWFVGGPWCAIHEHGTYIDPPLHAECCRYALQVCPYLAAPNYAKRIDARTLPEDHAHPIMVDSTMFPERPDIFIAIMSVGQDTHGGFNSQDYVTPRRPYRAMEVWREGRKLDGQEAERALMQLIAKGPPDPDKAQEPRTLLLGRG